MATAAPIQLVEPAPPRPAGLHVAIIMDGNGRWARRRGLPRNLGHRAGVEALRRTVEGMAEMDVSCLTVFGFSTENWRRPPSEVSELMNLLRMYFRHNLNRLEREGVRVRILGRRAGLDKDILQIVDEAEQRTAHNNQRILQVAFNYGGRADIVDAARRFAEAVARGESRPEDLDEAQFEALLTSAPEPAPDFIVRTSGELRLSNFLLWEAAYAELIFQDVFWPDYGPEHLQDAVRQFQARERRYGGVNSEGALAVG